MPFREINLNDLISLRKSYRLRWRIPCVFILLLVIYTCIQTIFDLDGCTNGMVTVYLTLLSIILISRYLPDLWSRWLYALISATAFTGISITIISFGLAENFWSVPWGLHAVSFMVAFLALLLIPKSVALFRSILNNDMFLYLKIQWQWTLRNSSQRKKPTQNNLSPKPGSRIALILALTLGSLTFLLGLLCWVCVILVAHLQNPFLEVLFGEAIFIQNIEAFVDKSGFSGILRHSLFFILIDFSGLFGGMYAIQQTGYLWHRWKRTQAVVSNQPITEVMSDKDILYLRPFHKEIKGIDSTISLSRLPFLGYNKNFSLEEIIADRLKFLGTLFALGAPSDKHPPIGAVRYYLPENWEVEIQLAMDQSKMLLAVVGVSNSLRNEIDWINQKDYLEKTLFIIPPLNEEQLKKTWFSFLKDLFSLNEQQEAFAMININRILAICFHDRYPFVITGKKKTELYYQSALDIGSRFILDKTNIKEKVVHSWYSTHPKWIPNWLWKFFEVYSLV